MLTLMNNCGATIRITAMDTPKLNLVFFIDIYNKSREINHLILFLKANLSIKYN